MTNKKRQLTKHERWFFIIILMICTQLVLQIGKAIFFVDKPEATMISNNKQAAESKEEVTVLVHGSPTNTGIGYIETEKLIEL
jgi:uncharacterized alpha/beta hydrolase family protein